MNTFLKIHEADNAWVALRNLPAGHLIQTDNASFTLKEDIPAGHKFASQAIAKGNHIYKYGYSIGQALSNLEAGQHIHSHNLATNLSDNLTYKYQKEAINTDVSESNLTVNGYLRSDGRMGIRNELWIIPTVGCVNGIAQTMIDRLKKETDTNHIDDIRVYTHNYGCSQLGDDLLNTQKGLAALAKHPNAGGVLVLSLGCENNQQTSFKKVMQTWDESRVRFLIAQEVEDEIEAGLSLLKELVQEMKKDRRQPLPISLLKVGLKCGGSDGFSGITANPLQGRFSDWLIGQGGTTILTEVPEMFGAETILMNRAENTETFNRVVSLINDFKDYFRANNQPIYENPSPGNKAGGITTLEEKSLGCTQKGGRSAVVDVLQYAQPATKKGLNLLNSPGNDLVSSSALAFAGCQLILFSTGRGTPFGSFVPTIKIATNSALYNQKKNWLDFNAGILLEGTPMDTLLQQFTEKVLAVAEGTKLKHEINGYKEIALFKTGVTL